MKTGADAFEQAWASHVRGEEADGGAPELRALVVVAEDLRSLQTAVPAPSSDEAWARLSERLGRELVPFETTVPAPRRRVPRRRLVLRLAAAAVAVFAAVATVSLRATPGSFLYPLRTSLEETALLVLPHDGALHLHIAEARLSDLVDALTHGPQAAAPGLARALLAQREATIRSHVSVTALDTDIRTRVPAALAAGVPEAIAQQVRMILGGLLPAPPAAITPPASEPPTGGGGGGRGGPHEGPGSNEGEGSNQGGSGEGGGSGDGDGGGSESGSGDQGGSGDGGGSGEGGGSGDQGGSGDTGTQGDQGGGSGDQSGSGDQAGGSGDGGGSGEQGNQDGLGDGSD